MRLELKYSLGMRLELKYSLGMRLELMSSLGMRLELMSSLGMRLEFPVCKTRALLYYVVDSRIYRPNQRCRKV